MKQNKIPSNKAFEEVLKRNGLSLDKFRDMIKDEMLVQKVVSKIREAVTVTPEDMREIRVSHILVSLEAVARDLAQKLKKGDNFATLAKEYSLDRGSAAKGGDVGFFTTGMMVEPFEKAAFKLKVGDISDIVKTPFGYHLITLTDTRLRKFAGQEKDFEKAALAEKQEMAFRRWFSDLRSQAKIEIKSPELMGNDYRFKGRLAEAIVEYKKAISQNPSNPYLHVFLGDVYSSMGKPDLAIIEFESAVSKATGNIELYVVLAQAYEKMGKKTEALQQYRRASIVAGDNKAIHQQLLGFFKKMGSSQDVSHEQSEISRIEKKEKFESGLKRP
jgi:tetratricopeptide (TPR) repeat protein